MGMYFDIQRAVQALKRKSEKGGLSITDVAKHSGLDRAVVAGWKRASRQIPRLPR